MLEICPSIAEGRIAIRCLPPVHGRPRRPGPPGVHLQDRARHRHPSLIDLGTRFRLIINDVECIKNEKPMPKLPVATNFWRPMPDFETGVEAWIYAGGAHHTAFTYDLTAEQMGDWAAAMGIEAVFIDKDTTLRSLKRDLMIGQAFYR